MAMERQANNSEQANHPSDCVVCGKPLRYEAQTIERTCSICGRSSLSNAVCLDGHFVCDICHSSGAASVISMLLNNEEKSPARLLQQAFDLSQVHMHGPEHHMIVPGVLLTAYRNNGGDIALEAALAEAVKRGEQVPGGICGSWGVCGAAVGAGIYASIVTSSNPLNGKTWGVPQELSSRCLAKISEVGGVRCCKRTSRIAVDTAIAFTRERWDIMMPEENIPCTFSDKNHECMKAACPYFNGS